MAHFGLPKARVKSLRWINGSQLWLLFTAFVVKAARHSLDKGGVKLWVFSAATIAWAEGYAA